MSIWLLPPNPGPFASLKQWREWREELRVLGTDTPGVDVELQIAERAIADALRERFDRNCEAARDGQGQGNSEHFLDKCESECLDPEEARMLTELHETLDDLKSRS
jgi:hypothetical protein